MINKDCTKIVNLLYYSTFSVNVSFLRKSVHLLLVKDQTFCKLMMSNDEGRVYQICKFHYPLGRGSCTMAWPYWSYWEDTLFFSIWFLSIEETNWVYGNSEQESHHPNCEFNDPRGAWVLVIARVWPYWLFISFKHAYGKKLQYEQTEPFYVLWYSFDC